MPEISNSENPYTSPTVDPIIPDDNPTEELELATRWERFLGSLIDLLILAVPIFAISWIYAQSSNRLPWFDYFFHVFEIVLFLITQGWFLATRSQTIGKFVIGTRIVLLNGRRPSFGRLIALRYAPFWAVNWIPTAGGWIELINVLFIFRKNRRCLHDLLAGTKVVKIGRFVPGMPEQHLMPPRNPVHPADVLSMLLREELDLQVSEIPYDSRWIEDLDISPESFTAFCRKLETHFDTLTLHELEKCATYGDLLRLLGIPQVKRFR